MKKRFNFKGKIFGLALIAAGAAATAPAVLPQTVMAAEANSMYKIVRNINVYYKYDDGTTELAGQAPYSIEVPYKNMKVTFPELKVTDIFKEGLGYWKPDKDIIPAVTATYANPPQDVNIYLTVDTSSYTEEEKVIKRTIKYYYVDESGDKKDAGFAEDAVKFKRTGYIDSSGKIVMNPWSGEYTFKEVPVEGKKGYTANMAVVPATTVTPSDKDFVVEVIYSKIPTTLETKKLNRNIYYIDKDTDKAFKTITQSVTLTREVYKDSKGNTVVVRDWNESAFSEMKVEEKQGYTPDKTTVPAAKVTADTTPQDVKIYYSKNASEDTVKDPVNIYTVTFTDGQGKTLKVDKVESGKAAVAPTAPKRDGYFFAGWDKSFDKVTASITVNAKWTKAPSETKHVERTIKFILKKADGSESTYRTMTQTADFSRTGYVDSKGNTVMPSWPSQTWPAVKYEAPAGYSPNTLEVPAVTFTPDNVPKDVTVYFNQNPSYTVKYYLDDSSAASSKTTKVEYGISTKTLTNAELGFNKAGKIFLGWKAYREIDNSWYVTDSTGKTAWKQLVNGKLPAGSSFYIYKNGGSISKSAKSGTVHFYGQWGDNAYTIKYHADDASAESSKTTGVQYGVTTKTLTNAELGFNKAGKIFLGWKAYREIDNSWYVVDSTGKTAWKQLVNGKLPAGSSFYIYKNGGSVSKSAVSRTVHFYGQWRDSAYTIKYHADDASKESSKTTGVQYGVSTKTLTNTELGFSKAGKSFLGWKAYREIDNSWYAVDSTGKTAWTKLVNGKLPAGSSFYIYKNGGSVSKSATSGIVHFYGQWK